MRKLAVGSAVFSLLAGIVGYFIRRRELQTVFDPISGLAQKNAPITLLLIALCVFVGLVLMVAYLSLGKVSAGDSYEKVFSTRTPLPLFVSILIFLGMLAGIAIYLMGMISADNYKITEIVFLILAAFTAFSIIIASYSVYKGKSGSEVPFCSIVPIAFLCFWLILAYRQRAADPRHTRLCI